MAPSEGSGNREPCTSWQMSAITVRIGTWNVAYASLANNARRLALLSAASADIWILTETRDEFDLGPEHTPVSSQPRYGTVGTPRWVTIWSRFPMTEAVPVRDCSRTVAALYATPLGPLLVYGTVLPWHSDRDAGDAANWVKHHHVISEQGAEWADLRERHHDAALCIAGDLNMNFGGPHYYGTAKGRTLLRAALTNAGLICVTGTDRIPAPWLGHAPIEHICLSAPQAARTRVVAAWEGADANGVRLSDHSGLVVEIAGGE